MTDKMDELLNGFYNFKKSMEERMDHFPLLKIGGYFFAGIYLFL